LIDTYSDEKEEAVKAAEALKDSLDGVRIDTPESRRGTSPNLLEKSGGSSTYADSNTWTSWLPAGSTKTASRR